MFSIKKIQLFIFCSLMVIANLSAQNADCNDLLEVKGDTYHTNQISGFGNEREFEGYQLENKKFFEQEENSIWYLLTMPADGIFTFDIETQNDNDDWDFLLFEYKTMFCKRIADKKIEPIRTNLSRSPVTGLSKTSNESFVGSGINSNYSKYITVKKGEQYVLVVNNPKRSGGKHTLKLHYPKEKIITPVVEEVNDENTIEKIDFKLSVKDAKTSELLTSDLSITGLKNKPVELTTISVYETQVSKQNHDVYIIAHAKGYMLTSKSFKIGKNEVTSETEILLEKIATGKKVNLKDIQFYGNRYDFLPSAKNSLSSLLAFMKENPTVAIEVEGHVNGPGRKNTKDYQELSYNRAYAVKDYLIENGIEKERIDFKGYGNSQMLYPDPKSEYQQSANRRVEIKIISNDFTSGTGNIH